MGSHGRAPERTNENRGLFAVSPRLDEPLEPAPLSPRRHAPGSSPSKPPREKIRLRSYPAVNPLAPPPPKGKQHQQFFSDELTELVSPGGTKR